MDNDAIIVLRQIEAHLRDLKEDAAATRLRLLGVLILLVGVVVVLVAKG